MAHPVTHAISSAKKYGGIPDDFQAIHDWFDQTKAHFPDNRHRALRHHSEGIFLCEAIFGHEIYLSCPECGLKPEGPKTGGMFSIHKADCSQQGSGLKTAKVRYVGEQHVLEDFGNKFIPTASDYLEHMDLAPWMNNGISKTSVPTSHTKLARKSSQTIRRAVTLD